MCKIMVANMVNGLNILEFVAQKRAKTRAKIIKIVDRIEPDMNLLLTEERQDIATYGAFTFELDAYKQALEDENLA